MGYDTVPVLVRTRTKWSKLRTVGVYLAQLIDVRIPKTVRANTREDRYGSELNERNRE